MTLTAFRKYLAPGMKLTRCFFEDGQPVAAAKQRVVSSVTSGGFCTRDYSLQTVSEMRFGKASEWEFDDYIDGFSALWTDPVNTSFQTQYIVMLGGGGGGVK